MAHPVDSFVNGMFTGLGVYAANKYVVPVVEKTTEKVKDTAQKTTGKAADKFWEVVDNEGFNITMGTNCAVVGGAIAGPPGAVAAGATGYATLKIYEKSGCDERCTHQ